MSLFDGLTPDQLARLAPLFGHATFGAGETMFSEGDPARTLYVLENGEAVIRFRPDDGGCLTIATIRAGDVCGWSAALNRSCYTASAVCLTDVQALSIRSGDLRAVIQTDPELGVLLLGRLASTVATRLTGAQALIARLMHEELSGSSA